MNTGLKCPQCGQADKIQKVSAVYTSGVSSVGYKTFLPPPPKSDLPPVLVSREGASFTALAKRLAPPPKPTWSDAGANTCLGVLSVIAILGVSLALFSIEGAGMILGPLAGIVGFILYAKWVAAQTPRHKELTSNWEEALAKWNALYYCARDDVVFNPSEGVPMPLAHMAEYIHRS